MSTAASLFIWFMDSKQVRIYSPNFLKLTDLLLLLLLHVCIEKKVCLQKLFCHKSDINQAYKLYTYTNLPFEFVQYIVV